MNFNDNGSYNSGPAPRPRKRIQLPTKRLLVILLAVLLVITALDSFYTLKEDQYAVITTFGKPSMVSSSGLKLKIPYIQRVTKVAKTIQGFPLGYRTDGAEVEDESLMIPYDYNFVNVDFYVEYRVTDPIKFLYNSSDPLDILRMLCQSYIRDTIGLYDVDSVITTGKSEIQAAIKQKVVTRLESEDIGLQLTNITIQDAEPPHEKSGTRRQLFDLLGRVAETGLPMCLPVEFGSWEGGTYTFYTWIDGADANEVIPAANADADQIIKSAEGYKESKINEANGQAARFKSLFDEYEKYPLITKQRLYYEAMEEILPGIKLYIVDENTGVQTALPLSPFASVDMGGEN